MSDDVDDPDREQLVDLLRRRQGELIYYLTAADYTGEQAVNLRGRIGGLEEAIAFVEDGAERLEESDMAEEHRELGEAYGALIAAEEAGEQDDSGVNTPNGETAVQSRGVQ